MARDACAYWSLHLCRSDSSNACRVLACSGGGVLKFQLVTDSLLERGKWRGGALCRVSGLGCRLRFRI